ncbi:MAG TPA: aldehyde dehydrogenase family protein [Acidimicrobiales bacterium]|jgi:acyl-CoA reductase-like NAD-dependent aldehyde dehydrogenase|nr:aldehyde dehydrogenase family protein [Acidimicrobiales bacterium]
MAENTQRDEHQLLIGGKWVDATDGTYDIINPATEAVVGQAPNSSAADALAAAAAAKEAQPAWAALSVEERGDLMRAAAAAIRTKSADLLPLVIAETGATATVGSRMQVPVAADRFERYARDPRPVLQTPLLPQAAQATPLAPGGIIGGMINRQPVGVVACITSYNFPMVNMAGKVAPALAAGNTVVVKPAPQDPLAIVELVRILDEVGFPPGVVNLVNGNGPTSSAALVDSEDVDCLSFTGSTQVGVTIAEKAARTMKRLLLELGGKGACVVFDDADVKAAIGCIGSTWSFHSGQICTAPTRAVVHRSIFEHVRDGLVQMAGALKVGDPTDTATIIGPVISAAQRGRIEAHVATAAADGGDVIIGGQRPADLPTGFYVAPTLITGDNSMRVAREEVFGPVITLIPFDDEDEAIAIANDTEFGLYDYVFSKDGARALRAAKQLQAGHVGINTAQRNHDAPFGGFKMSGVGRDGGDFGILAYSEPQAIIWTS